MHFCLKLCVFHFKIHLIRALLLTFLCFSFKKSVNLCTFAYFVSFSLQKFNYSVYFWQILKNFFPNGVDVNARKAWGCHSNWTALTINKLTKNSFHSTLSIFQNHTNPQNSLNSCTHLIRTFPGFREQLT